SAKGLEFPHVFVIGMAEESFPNKRAMEEGAEQEERRLAYVGITRARRTLTLTLAAKRKQFGEVLKTSPSRFIDELPAEDIEKEGFGEKLSQETARLKGQQSLSALKQLFD
ncbi:MAG TPA: ATP-dependent DNA helicase Rep, partial [Porticoccaceae bacterium]|nr:ATP-dependent DNA helicase Rep [Porticoccaceae bacterium]